MTYPRDQDQVKAAHKLAVLRRVTELVSLEIIDGVYHRGTKAQSKEGDKKKQKV